MKVRPKFEAVASSLLHCLVEPDIEDLVAELLIKEIWLLSKKESQEHYVIF